jgi:glutamate-1-semialdehyde 2,1-aminomutase
LLGQPSPARRRDSPVRAFQAVGGSPLFIKSGAGAIIQDVDGNRFIDYVMSWGPLIHGHAPAGWCKRSPRGATRHQLRRTVTARARARRTVQRLMPSLERVRFVSSGTEAAMSAIRVARAYTRATRSSSSKAAITATPDAFLVKAGSGALTLGIPTSPGVPAPVAADTLLARYNDLSSVDALLARARGQRAPRSSSSRSPATSASSHRRGLPDRNCVSGARAAEACWCSDEGHSPASARRPGARRQSSACTRT